MHGANGLDNCVHVAEEGGAPMAVQVPALGFQNERAELFPRDGIGGLAVAVEIREHADGYVLRKPRIRERNIDAEAVVAPVNGRAD